MTARPPGEVVVIDDDEAVCDALATLVSTHGYPSMTFTLGRDALRYVREGASPRLILVDARMPDLDGWQFLAELRRIGATHSFSSFLMSADTVLDERRARDLGARGILHKPFDLDELSTVIRVHCADTTESVILGTRLERDHSSYLFERIEDRQDASAAQKIAND